jgi:hypothetical protein
MNFDGFLHTLDAIVVFMGLLEDVGYICLRWYGTPWMDLGVYAYV